MQSKPKNSAARFASAIKKATHSARLSSSTLNVQLERAAAI
jgi:hypothetical protein